MAALPTPESGESANMSRAAQRKMRLMEVERQQSLEDMEALKMTEEQQQILWRSFSSVKMEFADLDGLCWTRAALLTRCRTANSLLSSPHRSRRPSRPSSPPAIPPAPAFTVLTNTNHGKIDNTTTLRGYSQMPATPQPQKARARSPVMDVFSVENCPNNDTSRTFSTDNAIAGPPIAVSLSGMSSANRTPSPSTLRPLPSVEPIHITHGIGGFEDDEDLKTPVAIRSYSTIDTNRPGRAATSPAKRKR